MMTKRQRLALAASSLAVGGGVVLLVITGTAGATAPTVPGNPVVSTVTVPAGQRGVNTTGPKPTATVWATIGTTNGTTSRTPSKGDDGATGGTSSVAPRTTEPGQQDAGHGKVPSSTAAPTPGHDAGATGAGEVTRTVSVAPGSVAPGGQAAGPAPTATVAPTK